MSNVSKAEDKKRIVSAIVAAAKLYKENLVGKTFLYVFNDRYIEVEYLSSGFRYLTGVDTDLSAKDFYKKAVSGKLWCNQIYFSALHPYRLCEKKIAHIKDIVGLATSECFMLENVTTDTKSYQFATSDLSFILCMNRRESENGISKSSKFTVESLRDEDGFDRATDSFEVTHILSKQNDMPLYTDIVWIDRNHSIDTLPACVAGMVDISDE